MLLLFLALFVTFGRVFIPSSPNNSFALSFQKINRAQKNKKEKTLTESKF